MTEMEAEARSGLTVRDAADRPELAAFCAFLAAYVYRDEAREELGAAMAALVRLARRTRTDGDTVVKAVHAVGCLAIDPTDPSQASRLRRYDWAMNELIHGLRHSH